jgi:hypothetical protein
MRGLPAATNVVSIPESGVQTTFVVARACAGVQVGEAP